jgi:Fungal Zn(2)-Cys(6) binuclear cluster domain
MARSDSSDRLSNFRSASGIVKTRQRHQQFACDRCRGQKLRCILTPDLHSSCERCQKAGATCVIDSSVRMGRPQRTDKERRETTNSSRKSQPTHSPNSPTLRRTSSQTTSKNSTANGNIWLGHDLEETIDSNLLGVQYQESLDFVLHNAALEDDQLHIFPSEDCFDNTFDFVSPQVPQNPSDFGMYELGSEETSGSMQPSPFISNEPVAISNIAAEKSTLKAFLKSKLKMNLHQYRRNHLKKSQI